MTNHHFTDFDPALRIVVDPTEIRWPIMDKMMVVAEDLYKHVKEQKATPKVSTIVKVKKKKFRENNPW